MTILAKRFIKAFTFISDSSFYIFPSGHNTRLKLLVKLWHVNLTHMRIKKRINVF